MLENYHQYDLASVLVAALPSLANTGRAVCAEVELLHLLKPVIIPVAKLLWAGLVVLHADDDSISY
jgi:hypothetical protein